MLSGLALVLTSLSVQLSSAAAQQAPGSTPSPQLLALPWSLFPGNAHIDRGPADNGTAGRSSGLHTISFDQLGRTGGYLLTARWNAAQRLRTENPAVSLQYVASMFPSPAAALRALGDARATLWELGVVTHVPGVAPPAYRVEERDGHRGLWVLLQQGAVEAELRLRFAASLDPASLRWSEWYLRRATARATTVIAAVAQAITASPPAPAPATDPTVFVAPWGTGPVVKSPSLMTLTPLSTDQADPGAYRPDAGAPLRSRVRPAAPLVSAGSLGRFVRSAAPAQGGAWYSAAGLYGNAASARAAVEQQEQALSSRRAVHHLDLPSPADLPPPDSWSAWRAQGETILLIRSQNVVLTLATSETDPTAVTQLARGLVQSVPTWLHAQGVQILDGWNAPMRLAYLNWYGAESPDYVVGGLDYRPYEQILTAIARMGYNGIRLPFSDQMLEQNPVVTQHLAANPELQGLHALDILDRIVAYAGSLGLSVILDNHRSDAGWSSQESGLWYTAEYPDAAFVHDWSTLAAHYAVNNVVVGADLRNEPHGPVSWGDNNAATDWRLAAQRAGNAVLAANPQLLVIVEGIQTYPGSPGYWWGGNLLGVATAPVQLQLPDGSSARSQLIYSAHDYGPDNCHGGCPWFNATTSYSTLAALWDHYWGYIMADPSQPYAAPVWLGEFGTCNFNQTCVRDTTPGSQGQWFASIVQYVSERKLGWAYWAVNGTQSSGETRAYGALEFYGLLAQNWTDPILPLNTTLATIQ